MSDPVPSSDPAVPPPEAEPAPRCPRCGTVGAPGDAFCEVDGARLAAEPPAAAVEAAPAAVTCPCGAAEDDGGGYCARCGHRLRPLAPDDHVELAVAPDLGAVSDRGLRHHINEDAYAAARGERDGAPTFLLVVCDGVSSSSDGRQAAAIAAGAARDALAPLLNGAHDSDREAAMAAAIRAAHVAACTGAPAVAGEADPPGTTIVAALAASGTVTLGWVGDSRAYWIGPPEAGEAAPPQLLTHDHSWVNEMVDAGRMTEEVAQRAPLAHALTHCIGALEVVDGATAPVPAVRSFTPPPGGGRLLLCSDGLWNYAPHPEQIAALLHAETAAGEATAVAGALVRHALACGGQDNVTVAIATLPAMGQDRSTSEKDAP